MNQQNWTDDQIMQQVKKAAATEPDEVSMTDQIPESNKHRDLLVVGCGDGGSMIAQQIRAMIPNTFAICYNTSAVSTERLKVDVKIIPKSEDGSGKVRDYSKEVFKKGSYKHLLGNVEAAIKNNSNITYVVVCSTSDGGTGSGVSPMVAKLISQNIDVPVILIGVYPALMEDATAQFNAMLWQTEVEKIGLPYMIFDNEIAGVRNKSTIHGIVNREIVECLKVITGDLYHGSTISTIDTRDLYMMIQHVGRRIVIGNSTTQLRSNQSLDEYVTDMLNQMHQPLPSNAGAIGIFLKGPNAIVTKMDTSLSEIRRVFGDAALQYTHVEESSEMQISVILAGCNEPVDRLYEIRGRYDDIMNAQKSQSSILGDLTSDLKSPVGTLQKNTQDHGELDLSALDL